MEASSGLLPRRPFVHVVVLFASDSRVVAYTNKLCQKFLDIGADVFMQVCFVHPLPVLSALFCVCV